MQARLFRLFLQPEEAILYRIWDCTFLILSIEYRQKEQQIGKGRGKI